jgi:alpha-L-fucosidase
MQRTPGADAADRAARAEWFRKLRFGLFLHYGIYSLMGEGEWVQLRKPVPLTEYEKLKDKFTADQFDAEAIAKMAKQAGMRYVNLTARHHDSFCLFKTNQTDYNSVDAPAKRDLIGELYAACKKHELGIFFYYSYALDWRHPHFYSREAGMTGEVQWEMARPPYEEPEPRYLFREDKDFAKYINFVHAQLRELLTQYPDVDGIWLDPIMGYYARPDLFPIEETYALIRKLNPDCLISFKQGANGDEDFVAPERTPREHQRGGEVGRIAWERNAGKPIEICDTLQGRQWGYNAAEDGKHKSAEEVLQMLDYAAGIPANLLLNSGPYGNGAIPPEDLETLRAVGEQLAKRA